METIVTKYYKNFILCFLVLGMIFGGSHESAYAQGEGKIKIVWLGHASFKITSPSGKVMLIDPWLEANPSCPAELKNLDNLAEKVDILLYTHGHLDHFMPEEMKAICMKFNPEILAIYELALDIQNLVPCKVHMANIGGTVNVKGIPITLVQTTHSSSYIKDQKNIYSGSCVGFIIEFENGFKIYHSSDTGLFSDMKFVIGEYYEPDLAILPIGDVFTMDPRAAGIACQWIKPKYAIPSHYGSYPLLVQKADEFVKFVKEYSENTTVIVLKEGKEYSIK